MSSIQDDNIRVFHNLSVFLNYEPRYITADIMRELTEDCAMSKEDAYALLLASAAGFDVGGNDRALFDRYFSHMVHHCSKEAFTSDPYLQTISFPTQACGDWTFATATYTPYEAFVYDDPMTVFDGRVIPQIGFFDLAFPYPAVLQNGREWMTVTPNEINTMKSPIEAARGHVLTFGLGLGYFAFMAGRKAEVTHVTVVERDPQVIRLFREHILPQFPCRDKIELIEADALKFAKHEMAKGDYNMVFADVWHDPSDGVEPYLYLKSCEKHLPGADYHYWIEKTLQLYL